MSSCKLMTSALSAFAHLLTSRNAYLLLLRSSARRFGKLTTRSFITPRGVPLPNPAPQTTPTPAGSFKLALTRDTELAFRVTPYDSCNDHYLSYVPHDTRRCSKYVD
ncbi:hypothetical protein GGR53DRAFT_483754 [Hypoxylon sp. FL1150]|nr:hypothetical protein GGR53DRAFT_483754 [Hypoxylon sp. FL1150]